MMTIALRYSLFALIATAANIGSQHLVVMIDRSTLMLLFSVAVGTGVGLVVKYLLDKRYIFRYQTRDAAHNARTFTLYTTTGIATTAIFWGMEWLFHLLYATDSGRYLGGVIGLAIGYWIKYQLDKRYVFAAAD
jgi:putative flippase GtrA